MWHETYDEMTKLIISIFRYVSQNRWTQIFSKIGFFWEFAVYLQRNVTTNLPRLDKYRPRKEGETSDLTFESHIYFDDAFKDVPGSRGRHVNTFAETLVEIIKEVYG